MPSKPAKYGLKLWVACDARSSYAWKMQVYMGKREKGAPPEKDLATRVVLDLTEDLGAGRIVTCDNFFTSYKLARRLYSERGLALLGTLRANRNEIPRQLLDTGSRAAPSTVVVFTWGGEGGGKKGRMMMRRRRRGDEEEEETEKETEGGGPPAALVSYLPDNNKKNNNNNNKKKKNVLILTTAPLHLCGGGSGGDDDDDAAVITQGKPHAVLHYNRTKGGVDNLDKVTGTYSCRRKTSRWPLALFHNMIDVSAYNAFVLWRELNPTWLPGKRNKRRIFMEELGKALVAPRILRRKSSSSSSSKKKRNDIDDNNNNNNNDDDNDETKNKKKKKTSSSSSSSITTNTDKDKNTPGGNGVEEEEEEEEEEEQQVKRKRCRTCPRSKDCKTKKLCIACGSPVCITCALTYCPPCAL